MLPSTDRSVLRRVLPALALLLCAWPAVTGAQPAESGSTPPVVAETKTPPAAAADPGSPVGLWKTIDDETGQPKSLVLIVEQGGRLQGKITKLFRKADEVPDPLCDKCEGTLKNVPIVGMTILKGFQKDGDEYSGGTILDPGNGKTYKCNLELQDGGKKLKVRGYIGISLIGRTQIWQRAQ